MTVMALATAESDMRLYLALGALCAILAGATGVAVAETSPPVWATVPDVPSLPAPDRSGYVDRAGARIYFAVFNAQGSAPVVLLHGGLSASDSWGFEVPKLTPGHEVIVIDSRGHGRSTMGDGLSYGQMEGDLLSVLDTLNIQRASLVGLSDGGDTALMFAIDHPERTDKLFVWGANFNTHADKTTPPDPAIAAMGPIFMPKMEAQYRRLSPTPDGFPALRQALNAMYANEPNLTVADLARIQAPTVVADGQYEQFIDSAHTALMANSIPHARLVIVPNVSHGGPQQDPVAFHNAVESLLDP